MDTLTEQLLANAREIARAAGAVREGREHNSLLWRVSEVGGDEIGKH